MGWMRRAKASFAGKKLEKELDDEVQFHLSMREERNVEQGMPLEECSTGCVSAGNPDCGGSGCGRLILMTPPETIWQDLKFGARTLVKHPGFTAMAILALALGIGINVTVFTIYKAMILRPIDGKNASEFVDIALVDTKHGNNNPYFSYPDYEAYRDGLRAFSGLIVTDRADVTLSGAGGAVAQRSSVAGTLLGKLGLIIPTALTGGAENVRVAIVSENYFDVLGDCDARSGL